MNDEGEHRSECSSFIIHHLVPVRIAVLAAADSWYFADLRRAAGDRHDLSAVSFRSISSAVLQTTELGAKHETRMISSGADLQEFDAILVRTMPAGSLEQVVFRMDALARLEAGGVPVVNPARAIECAVDKYLTTARLAAAGLPTPRTIVCQTPADGMQAFGDLGGDVVLKPLFGGEGRGITRIEDPAIGERAFRLLADLGSVLYLQQFIAHEGADIRVLIIGSQTLAMRRTNRLDWRTNVSRGALAEAVEPRPEWVQLARRAADVVGATVAGVDLLPGRDGRTYVIEVNAVPGWKALAQAHNRDIAAMVLDHLAAVAKQA
jgi:ribosomal protein S6--L-glutamate ligase